MAPMTSKTRPRFVTTAPQRSPLAGLTHAQERFASHVMTFDNWPARFS
jgi:hypothetical protein